MEKTYKALKLILLILVFVAVLLGANRLYETLGNRVQLDTLATQATDSTDETQQEMPDFTVYDIDGNPHKLSDFRGKPVILNFWATWCGFCEMEMPDFEEAYKQYGQQIHFLMVDVTDGSQETVEKASAFIAEKGYTFPVYYDTAMEASSAYGTGGLPVTYLFDAEGGLAAWQQGMLTADTLQKGIDLLLAE